MENQREIPKWAPGAASAMVGVVAACSVCCAPLVAPIIAGALGAVGLGACVNALGSWQTLAAIALAGGAAGIVLWRLKSSLRRRAASSPSCRCADKCGN